MEGKRKGKKKKKTQGGKKSELEVTKGLDSEVRERFKRLLGVYYKEYDMLEVSRLLEA